MTTRHRRTRPPFMPHQDQGRHDGPSPSMPLCVVVFSLLAWAAIIVLWMAVFS